MMLNEESVALACGHTFRTECVTRYATCKAIPLADACPMRCNKSKTVQQAAAAVAAIEDTESSPGATGSSLSAIAANVEADAAALI